MSVTCDGPAFSSSTPVSSKNKTDRQNITEILLKVALDTINQSNHYFNTHTACLEHRTYLDMYFSGVDVTCHLTSYCGLYISQLVRFIRNKVLIFYYHNIVIAENVYKDYTI